MSSELDKHFSDKLRGYESELDTEALWEAVRPPRQARWGLWLLLLCLLLIGLGGGLYWWLDDSVAIAVTLSDEQQGTRTSVEELTTNNTTAGEAKNSAAKTSTYAIESADTNRRLSEENARTIYKKTAEPTVLNPSELSAVMDEQGAYAPTKIEKNTVELTAAGAMASAPVEADLRSTAEETVEVPSALTRPATHMAQQGSALETIATLPSRLLVTTTAPLDKTPERNALPTRNNSSSWFVGLEGGFFKTKRTLDAAVVDSLGNAAWLAQRQATETALDAYSIQLSVGYQTPKGWQLRTGLAYTQLTNAFEYTASETLVDSVEGIKQITIDPVGDSTVVMGMITRWQNTSHYKRTYNRVQQWEVPLLLGYRMERGNWNFVLEGGPRFLLSRSWSGEILDVEDNIQSWEETLEYRQNVSLQGLDLGAQVQYRLNAQLSIGLGAWGRLPLQDMSLDSAPQRESYRLLGGQLGLFYGF